MSESSGTTFCLGQIFNNDKLRLFTRGDDHLGDAVAMADNERLCGKVDENHHDFASVIGIDGAGSVQHSDAVLYGKAATGSDLTFVTLRNFHEKPGGD